jgi:hypothetical protein
MTDQFSDATKKMLSPAGQAVLDAVREICPAPADEIAAAALRAAADQVVPEPPITAEGGRTYAEGWTVATLQAIRHRFLAIAAELEGDND